MAERQNPAPIQAEPDATRTARRTRSRSRSGQGQGASMLVSGLLVAALVGLVGAAYFIVTQQEQLAENRGALADAQRRIGQLEDRLRLTDETITEADADTSEQLSFWEDEIRKLWDIANKRNKTWIEQNRASVQQLTGTVAAAQSDLSELKSAVSRAEATAGRQQQLADDVLALQTRLEAIVRQQRDLVDKANAASQIASRMESRVRENEQAITAIDAHRQSVNSELADLRRRLATPPIGP